MWKLTSPSRVALLKNIMLAFKVIPKTVTKTIWSEQKWICGEHEKKAFIPNFSVTMPYGRANWYESSISNKYNEFRHQPDGEQY